MADRVYLSDITDRTKPITCLTCYDYLTARVMDQVDELDMILVGDSLGMVELGYSSTIPVTVDDMVHHTAAVSRGVDETFVATDVPFLQMARDRDRIVQIATRLMQEGGSQAIKIEGGESVAESIDHLTSHDVPVLGHLGLTPQSVESTGGYQLQANDPESVRDLGNSAKALCDAGISALFLECVPEDVASKLTEKIDVPTIGIGAGSGCDGQVLVWQDMMGLNEESVPNFVRKWGNWSADLEEGIREYCVEVRERSFPSTEESFDLPESLQDADLDKLLSL